MMRLKKQMSDDRRKYSHVVNTKVDKFGNGTANADFPQKETPIQNFPPVFGLSRQ